MSGYCIACQEKPATPRVVVVGLASCFGCQLQITNAEAHLLDVLGQIDVRYWQLTSSDPMPEEFDVAVIEGAVTTEEAEATVRQLRERAGVVITIGACATTAGIPGMAAAGFLERPAQVYAHVPEACGEMIAPRPVQAVIDVDFEVRTCPVDSLDFVDVLQRALYGSNKAVPTRTMCGDCKRNETSCFFGKQQLCLGLVTRAGCGARCVNLGRPCNGCRGLSPDANLPSAREACERYGVPVADFDKALEMFNQVNPPCRRASEETSMTKTAIHVDHVARIEGHGNVHVVIEDGIVKTVEMNVVEPARLFESMVRGRSYREVSYISSRICGICSASHVVTDLKAIERAFGVQVTPRTRALRELLVYGSYLQNHATHLFVLAAPDFVGQKSVFPLAETDPELFDKALGLKALGNELCTKVGGRSIHPITAVVGGFTHELEAGEYRALAEKMDEAAAFAAAAVDLFASFPVPSITTAGDMLAMVEPDYYPVECSDTARFLDAGIEFDANDVAAHLEEYEMPHSAALLARVRETGSPFFTGALARINASWQHLGQNAKVAAAKAGLRPPERNPFMNNVAQAVELVDALDRCAGICRALAEPSGVEGSSEPVGFEVKAGRGVGFTEAPRGALFHALEFDDEGRVVHASIMTPTAQNVANLEADMRLLAEQLVAEGAREDAVRGEIEKLVRAYDPCLSCSVH